MRSKTVVVKCNQKEWLVLYNAHSKMDLGEILSYKPPKPAKRVAEDEPNDANKVPSKVGRPV